MIYGYARVSEGRCRAQKRGQHMGRPAKLTAAQKAEAGRQRTEVLHSQLGRGKEHDFPTVSLNWIIGLCRIPRERLSY